MALGLIDVILFKVIVNTYNRNIYCGKFFTFAYKVCINVYVKTHVNFAAS